MGDLHITNGDSAARLLRESAVSGDILAWRDPMHHGPFPAGLDLAALSQVRADYLAGPGFDRAEVARGFRLRDDHLRAASRYRRVLLWFEHDLLDQLQILQLLDWFATAELEDTALELICIDRFEGIEPFRGLGQLSPAQLASLHDRRQAVSQAALRLARRGWAAFRAAEPTVLEDFLTGDLTPIPFLRAALMRHLEEYPDSRDGLTRTERQILSLVGAGHALPEEIFRRNMAFETALFIGDWATYGTIARLSQGETPLLASRSGAPFLHPPGARLSPEAFRAQELRPSERGEAVLAGEISAFGLVARDCWLGGVHLRSDRPLWTWDGQQRRLRLKEVVG